MGKGIYLTILPPSIVGQTRLFNFDMETGLTEGKLLNSN